jgi:hypothetical protein
MLRLAASSLGLILLAPLTVPAIAQSPLWTRCMKKEKTFSSDVQISSCATLIQSGKEPTKNRGVDYVNRGNAY